ILHHFGITEQFTSLRPQWHQADMGHEIRAVLADAKTLLFEAARSAGGLELAPGLALCGLVRLVKAGEMAAQDLALAPAGDLLAAGIPADDPAVGGEHENRGIGYRIHQEPEIQLRMRKKLLRWGGRRQKGVPAQDCHPKYRI